MTRIDTLKLQLPGQIDAERFVREYWHKRPLLMRAALPVGALDFGADELAGLACEAEVESRIISGGDDQPWQLSHGPFDETDFTELPDARWTLLVQDVDKFVPSVAALIPAFDFVPQWRIDDIMISYATDGGGVGPHTDAYDVFLVQASGRRRWRLSYREYGEDDLIADLEQRILARFDSDEDWILEPGDVLYLPPGVAHWGTAVGECMTYSLGFRAPSQVELAGDWFQHLLDAADRRRLPDPAEPGEARGEISTQTVAAARAMIDTLFDDADAGFARWLGCYLTEPKPQFDILPLEQPVTATELAAQIAGGPGLLRHPAARLAWSRSTDGAILLFCQGVAHRLTGERHDMAEQLCTHRCLAADQASALLADDEVGALLVDLYNDGVFETAAS
jgi:50S ribosomal protein L16 3-hydroxylase